MLIYRRPEARRRRSQRIIHHTFRYFTRMMQAIGVLTFETHELERLQRPGLLIIANHPSLLDVVFLISFLPEVDCVVKRGLWRNPFTAVQVRACGYIANADPESVLDECTARLHQGHSLIIFPEGTRTRPGQPLRLQRGAANLAVRAGVGFTPVIIHCNPPHLPKHRPWYRVPPRRPHYRFEVKPDIDIQMLTAEAPSQALAARRVTDYLVRFFREEMAVDERPEFRN